MTSRRTPLRYVRGLCVDARVYAFCVNQTCTERHDSDDGQGTEKGLNACPTRSFRRLVCVARANRTTTPVAGTCERGLPSKTTGAYRCSQTMIATSSSVRGESSTETCCDHAMPTGDARERCVTVATPHGSAFSLCAGWSLQLWWHCNID